ncbi:hypothetical protein EG68_09419 [Paragonimus skrjabini miyazakii]|uniref:Uncharacterized protein n=1 Tax=Paragonimus skrjabini miyazakii TaxID=59628 RepID=A0A8S9YNF9_9TREM|nr:hypothetical protein EG68_09419 [Paragonimus skrjabini miyazakii]
MQFPIDRKTTMPFCVKKRNAYSNQLWNLPTTPRQPDFAENFYANEILESIHFYGEINPGDSVCYIGPKRKGVTSEMVESKLFSHFSSRKESDLSLPVVHGEDFCNRPNKVEVQGTVCDKIFIYECMDLILDKSQFFKSIHSFLNPKEGILLLFDRLTCAPSFVKGGNYSAVSTSVKEGLKETLKCLLDSDYDVEWDIIDLPMVFDYRRWFGRLYTTWNTSTAIEVMRGSEFHEYINRMLRGPLMYTAWDPNGYVRINEQVFITVARPRIPRHSAQMSIKRYPYAFGKRNSEKIKIGMDKNEECTLYLQPAWKPLVAKHVGNMIQRSFPRLDQAMINRQAEWWGTVNANEWNLMDSSRIPRKRLNIFKTK